MIINRNKIVSKVFNSYLNGDEHHFVTSMWQNKKWRTSSALSVLWPEISKIICDYFVILMQNFLHKETPKFLWKEKMSLWVSTKPQGTQEIR